MNYYNDNDQFAVKWLKELIADGLIPKGDVDDRSITDIAPKDLDGYVQCHFFAGIGGWAYALRLAGWPDDRPVWTGSCPCQPFSVAGKGGGLDDERHLWPAFRWLIAQCKPATVFGEQVASKDGRSWLAGVRADLERMGYRVGAADLCAAGIGAPHIRQRLWWVGYTGSNAEGSAYGGERREFGNRLPDIGERREVRDDLADDGRDGGMGNTEGERCGEKGNGCRRSEERAGDTSESDRLAYAPSNGSKARISGQEQGEERIAGKSYDGGSQIDWFSAVWWPCRDGKYRRVPARRLEDAGKWEAQPFFQSVVDGLSSNLGDVWTSSLQKINGRIEKYAEAEKIRPDQVLREMRDFIETEEIRGKSGGLNQIYEEEVLLVALCQLQREMGRVPQGVSEGIDQVQEGLLREMREEAGRPEATPCSSQEHELERKCSEQLRNFVHELSHEVSQCEEAIGVIEAASSCFPLAGNIPNRVGILRGAGNSIVPQVAERFIRAFLDIQN